ncbi:MAG: transcription-repair coupling factor [Treponema sp.]|nr:transcription-repair coupling factor [Treponema sp.]
MKSLYSSINKFLHNWQDFSDAVNKITDDNSEFPIEIEGIQGCLFSYFLSELSSNARVKTLQSIQYSNTSKKSVTYQTFSQDMVIVVPGEYELNNIITDINALFPDAQVFAFPGWGVIPYRPAARGSVVFGQRAGFLAKLLERTTFTSNATPRIFLLTQRSFISPLPPPDYTCSFTFSLKKNDSLDTVKIAQKLISLGYTRVSRVNVRGEFSLRGEVLDIFLPLEQNPVRIVFDFDEIESIKDFEADSQITLGARDKITIYPMKEVLWTDELVEKLRQKLTEYQDTALAPDLASDYQLKSGSKIHLPFTEHAKDYLEMMLDELSVKKETEGEELYYSLLWDKEYTILDYLTPDTFVLFYDYDRLLNAELAINREQTAMYRKTRETTPVLPPDMITLDFKNTVEKVLMCLLFRTISDDNEQSKPRLTLEVEPARSFFGNLNYLKEELTNLQNDGWNITIFTDNDNQQLRIHEIFKDWTDIEPDGTRMPVQLIPKAISAGFSISKIKLLVIQENEIFGRRKYVAKSVNKAKSKAIDTFVELNPGDYIVHVNWGIGLFHGIERVKSLGNERDYIKLEYADEEFAFVPIEQVNLVQRYIGNEGERPRLDRIGSKSWEARKSRVQKAVEDLAQKLIDLYSRRKASVGYAFPKEKEWQSAFEAAFPYEDTPDQITVTEEVKADMEKPIPMDRLICGDVGYGKTEIAMRAAFKAVMGGKQVAFLAPTTILAEQHYETLIERFKNFPVKIARLSRFVAAAEQKKILSRLEKGELDILVGTHRIIQKDVNFKNLGLMIIDEEQRFGVKDKERLKEMKNNVDCLTMSATPIPRTLHMSLLKIRDMSLLTTPPQNRQAIETVIDEFSDARIAAAIRQEMDRGGQIFFLHNRVESLLEVRQHIEKIVPECLVDVAHGQMTSQELDDIFHRFKMGGFHVLIATTIIENGIDIPNVNTIIIDRADMYGVSQLYQLRGRVGRSDRKAYAYLLYPKDKALSEVAMKRLQVISDFTELGSGFKIAMKDMEIRGAGNLLGKDQSGDVYAVGFDMYMRLLNEAVNRLTAQKDYKVESEVLMELEYTGYIPDTYVTVPQIKMEIYKKIASITTNTEFEAVITELSDRFGPIPDEVSSLLALAEIRIICKKLSITSIREKQGEVKVEFGSVADFSIDKFMKLLKDNPGTIRLNPAMPNVMFIKLGKIGLKEKSEFIREKLSQLA